MRVKEESEKAGLKLNIQKTKIMVSGPITMANRWGKSRNSGRFYFLVIQLLLIVTAAMKSKDAYSLEEKL